MSQKFIKAVHGNVIAANLYFTEGAIVPVDEDIADSSELVNLADKGYLKIFSSMNAATKHQFRTIAERLKAGEDVSKPLPVTTATNTPEPNSEPKTNSSTTSTNEGNAQTELKSDTSHEDNGEIPTV